MKSVKQQYIDLQEGKMSQTQFLRNIRLTLPQYVTNVTSFDDSIRILKNKGILSEADTKSSEGEGKWKTVTGKDLYGHFKEIDNLNGQEVVQGIDWEMENKGITKDEAIKIVIKNLKKNQFYYTSQDMSGVEGYEMEYMGPKADIEARQMQYLEKNMSNVVDKKMGMKPVKGFENAKASSNKASKETNKGEEIDIMSLVAKTVRGLVKMDATGEKAKKIVMKEGEEMDTMALVQRFINSNPTLRQHANDIELENSGKGIILKYGFYDTLPDELYSKLELQFDVNGMDDYTDEEGEKVYYTLTPKKSPYNSQYSGVGLQSPLEEEIRKQVKEMFDGMEPDVRTGMDV
jgi:hypothetical protein